MQSTGGPAGRPALRPLSDFNRTARVDPLGDTGIEEELLAGAEYRECSVAAAVGIVGNDPPT